MNLPTYDSIAVGNTLPPLITGPVSRSTLALFAAASGDHNPIHIDIDFAQSAGMPDVFAHGMLGMAYLGRLLTNWIPQHDLRDFSTRFTAITHLNETLICTGTVVEKHGDGLVRLEIQVANDQGVVKLTGQALIWLP